MRETIRCCIACILPCGALDVVRIVHANGKVEEISHAIRAADVMQKHPKHVIRKPPPTSTFEDYYSGTADVGEDRQKATILPPTAELKKGKIYFLMPVSEEGNGKAPTSKRRRRRRRVSNSSTGKAIGDGEVGRRNTGNGGGNGCETAGLLVSEDRYLTEILSEKVVSPSHRDRRRGRVGVWRPHLESISEVDLVC